MFDEPKEDPIERSFSQADRAREKSDEIRMYSELAAVFEGTRKFDAELLPGLDADLARQVQRGMAKLDRCRSPDSPVLPPTAVDDAAMVLAIPAAHGLSTNDYHIHRRPGEVMITRWLSGDQVDSFYERLQAHFEAGFNGYRDEERQANEWRQGPETIAYLEALDALDIKMVERYLRDPIRQHNLFVLSTQAADEFNIAYLSDYVMGVPAAEIVGGHSAPGESPTEQELTWFFKLFALRGMAEGVEQMCFFAFLQKSDDMDDFDG